MNLTFIPSNRTASKSINALLPASNKTWVGESIGQSILSHPATLIAATGNSQVLQAQGTHGIFMYRQI